MKTKPNQRQAKSKYKVVLNLIVITIMLISAYFLYMSYSKSKVAEAESNRYKKVYPAGKIVDFKKTRVYKDGYGVIINPQQANNPSNFITTKSIGKKVNVKVAPNGPTISGWRSPYINYINEDQYFHGKPNYSYISKYFTIPKNKSSQPMAVELCWRSITGSNSQVFITLSRDDDKNLFDYDSTRWTKTFPNANHDNPPDHLTTSRAFRPFSELPSMAKKVGCYGFSNFIYESVNSKKPLNKAVRARMYVGVSGGKIEIAAIRVLNVKEPRDLDWSSRKDFTTGKFLRLPPY